MPNILLASACPAVQQPTGFIGLAAAQSAPNSRNAETDGTSLFVSKALQPHAARLDILAASGGANAHAILVGSSGGTECQLAAPSLGLMLRVRRGQCLIGTQAEVPADTTFAVPDNTTRVWVWLLITGVLSATVTTTPPSTACCLLGSCVTLGGNITSVDSSGVLYLQGGVLWRNTADAGAPTDSPPASVAGLKTLNPFCTYEWDGVGHRQMYMPIRTSDPASPQNGDIWFRTDTGFAGTRIQTAGGILTGTGATAPM